MLTALYIHIPFCDQICIYCDFHKEMAKESKKKRYINALLTELKTYKNELKNIRTIYIGGGSPTSLEPKELIMLLSEIRKQIDLSKIAEYTIESNPNDVTPLKANILKEYGINRVSLGVQTFNDKHLTFLGRNHKKADIASSIALLRANDIQNVSIDLIFSLPGQTLEEVQYDIKEAISLKPSHISYYSLIFEEKTKLYYMYEQDKIAMNPEDLEADMYEAIIQTLPGNGYHHYEISNYALKGFESKHNTIYWKNKPYLGIGSGSHSLYQNKRFFNIPNVTKYIEEMTKGGLVREEEAIEPLRETLMMGLRLLEGVNVTEIEKTYDIKLLERYPALQEYIDTNILTLIDNQLSFTKKGLMLGNLVFSIF